MNTSSFRLCFAYAALSLSPLTFSEVTGPQVYYYRDKKSYEGENCGWELQYDERKQWQDSSQLYRFYRSGDACFNNSHGYTDFYDDYWFLPDLGTWADEYGTMYGVPINATGSAPSAPFFSIPQWIKGTDTQTFSYFGDTITETRDAETTIAVYSDSGYNNKPNQLVAFQVSATVLVWSGFSGAWGGAGDWSGEWSYGQAIPPSAITVGGKQVDCNGRVWFEIPNNGGFDVTPVVTGYPFYKFDVQQLTVKKKYLDKTHHPLLSTPPTASDIQNYFNSASIYRLATDNDSCYVTSDPAIQSGGDTFRGDDFPVYCEIFTTAHSPETFPASISSSFYNVITSQTYLDAVHNNGTGSIRILQSMTVNGQTYLGVGYSLSEIILAQSSLGLPSVLMHEMMHTFGLDHRGNPNNPAVNGCTNCEKTNNNTEAIMYYQDYEGGELNRYEAAWF